LVFYISEIFPTALVFENKPILLVIVIMLLQVRIEKKLLRRDFDEEYKAYCRRTGRVWP